MTLATLLEELSTIDPEEWEEIMGWFGGLKTGLHGHSISPQSDLAQALIQNSIQRACERRGWTWELSLCSDKKTYIADAFEIAPGYSGDYWEEDHEYLVTEKESTSPAEALLAAYIAAVKEEAKR